MNNKRVSYVLKWVFIQVFIHPMKRGRALSKLKDEKENWLFRIQEFIQMG
jgi:hypothetical protein